MRLCIVLMAAGVAIVLVSHSKPLTGQRCWPAGWTASVTLFNVGIQLCSAALGRWSRACGFPGRNCGRYRGWRVDLGCNREVCRRL